jgi:hypothetical protein
MNSADDSLETVISDNLVAMNEADESLDAAIASCCTSSATAVDSIETLIEANETANDSADASLAAAITAENSGRVSADASLETALGVETARIDAILEGSEVDLDQFAEIVSFVNGIDLENDAALLSAVTSIGLAIDDVEDAMESADGSLASVIATNKTDANTAISAEASSRVSADGSLESVIAINRNDANTAISDEESARIAGDELLQGNLDSAVEDLDAEDVRLAGLISAEVSRAEAAEDSLEAALSTEVANLISNTDLRAIDSFSEVVAELGAITEEFNNTYFKKVTVSGLVDGENQNFTLAFEVRPGSEAIYYNGLLQEEGVDYNIDGVNVDFTYFPAAGGKVTAYGVYA